MRKSPCQVANPRRKLVATRTARRWSARARRIPIRLRSAAPRRPRRERLSILVRYMHNGWSARFPARTVWAPPRAEVRSHCSDIIIFLRSLRPTMSRAIQFIALPVTSRIASALFSAKNSRAGRGRSPRRRIAASVKSRIEANTRGAAPDRTRQPSSRKVTSRT